MELKSDDIFNVDFDSSIWLSYGLEQLNLDIQLDIESALLSVEDNKVNEQTNSFKDIKNQDLKMSVTNEKPAQNTELEERDINGNEQSSSDENFIQLFGELELSDSDNEVVDDDDDNEAVNDDNEAVDDDDDDEAVGEEGSELRERGPESRRVTRRRNRTNYFQRNERYDRSQFPARSLEFLSGSTLVQSFDTPLTVIEPPIVNITETLLTSSNDSLSSPISVAYEDRPIAFGSPESGYESSLTGSPPQVSSLPVPNLDSIPENQIPEIDDINDIISKNNSDCALSDHNILKYGIDDKDYEEEVKKIYTFLTKDIPYRLNESSDADSSRDYVPSNDNASSGNSSPRLRHVDMCKRIEFKLDCKARNALYQFLSDDEYRCTQARTYRQIMDDIANNREIKVIHVVDEVDGTSENRTNLHHAVINSNIEEIFCLVEIQKQYQKPLSDINIRDKFGKTALDYAVLNKMTLVVDYLKENTACQSVTI